MKATLTAISLMFFSMMSPAYAVTIENSVITETGGTVSADRVEAQGTSDASASVRSIIRTEGSNTNVRVDIRTEVDGTVYATSSERKGESGNRFEVRVAMPEKTGSNSPSVALATSTPRLTSVFDRFRASFASFFNFLFFF